MVRPESARRLLAADAVRPAHRVAARSGRRLRRVRVWRSAQPERHSGSERQSEPVRCAAVAYPRLRRPAVQWATELDSALRRAASVRLVQPSAEADRVREA